MQKVEYHQATTGYQPQANGQIERLHRWLNATLAVLAKDNVNDWDLKLQTALFAYRVSAHKITGFSLYQLMYGRDPILPSTLWIPEKEDKTTDYASSSVARMKAWFKQARANQDRATEMVDKKDRGAVDCFKKGDWVLYWSPADAITKFHPKWRGPYLVDSSESRRPRG